MLVDRYQPALCLVNGALPAFSGQQAEIPADRSHHFAKRESFSDSPPNVDGAIEWLTGTYATHVRKFTGLSEENALDVVWAALHSKFHRYIHELCMTEQREMPLGPEAAQGRRSQG